MRVRWVGLSYLGAVVLAGVLLEVYLGLRGLPAYHEWGWRYIGSAARNELGFRGRSIEYGEDNTVILLVGDSQVEAGACRPDEMPEQRLEQELRRRLGAPVAVFSIGASGYGQDQQLLALREYLARFRADHVLLWETPSNDLWNNLFPTHWPRDGRPKPTFWLDEAGALQGPRSRYAALRGWTLIQHELFSHSLDDAWAASRLPPAYRPMQRYDGPLRSDWQLLNPAHEFVETGKTSLALGLDPTSERIRYGMALTRRLLQRMREEAQQAGATFSAFAVRRPDFPLADGVYRLDREEGPIYVRFSRRLYWENLRAMNEGIPLLEVPVRIPDYFTGSDAHLNPAGVADVMSQVAEQLGDRLEGPGYGSAEAGRESR